MQSARAAARDQRKSSRIDAALDADEADGMEHALLGDADNAGRRVQKRQIQGFGDFLHNRPDRQITVERQRPAGIGTRAQTAQNKLGIGHGRIFAAFTV